MSSLRIESLRLVWLETFLTVSESENISAAARAMGVDQSTVSRYMIALQKWLGKDLIALGAVVDDKDHGRNVGLTEAGIDFIEIAENAVASLVGFRTDKARRKELLDSMQHLLDTMLADLDSKKPSQTVLVVQDHIKVQRFALAALRDQAAPLDKIAEYTNRLRRFFATYEDQLKRERKAKRGKSKASSAAHIDMSAYRKPKPEA